MTISYSDPRLVFATDLPKMEKLMLAYLLVRQNAECVNMEQVTCSVREAARAISCSRPAAQRILHRLETRGVLFVHWGSGRVPSTMWVNIDAVTGKPTDSAKLLVQACDQ